MYLPLATATLKLLDNGISVYPCYWKNKVPALQWSEYKRRLPTKGEINGWFKDHPYNVAAVTGRVSDNLVILDFDNGVGVTELSRWCKERDLRTWTVKTLRGWHVHLRVKQMPAINFIAQGDIEVICNGSALVPPSVHFSGQHYATLPLFGEKIAWVDSLDGIGIIAQANACADPKKERGEEVCMDGQDVPHAAAFSSFLRVCGGRSPSAQCEEPKERIIYDSRIRDLEQRKVIMAEIKRRIPMPTLLRWFTELIPSNRSGMYYAACPLHDDGHPSLMSNADRCFCNSTRCKLNHWADVIDAYATITGSDLWQTLTVLGRKGEVL